MKSTGEAAGAENIRVEALYAPIPNLSTARANKEGYRDYPIDKDNPFYEEEVVNIYRYGLAGQAYYSRPNAATGEPVAEVPQPLFLRKSVAEKLSDINQRLNDPIFVNFFGRPVELYLEDAHRSFELQKKLYDEVFPHLVWQQNPGISDDELAQKLQNLIAAPSDDKDHPAPHATGGAVDVILRYKQDTPRFVKGAEVNVGHVDGDTSKRVYPDYYELIAPTSEKDKLAKTNRRAFYAVMTGEVFGFDTQLQVNPTEWWHWSYGDQMWAKLQSRPAALYSLAENPNSKRI